MRALVIAAHPDDEVLGCGGTISKLAAQGHEIHILILANGLTSRTDFDAQRDAGALAIHHARSKRVGELLGAASVTLAGFPDQKMDTLPLLDVTQRIEQELFLHKPEAVFTHHGGDLNMDHVITYRATLTATRPTPTSSVKSVYAFEVASSTEWSFQRFEPKFHPSLFFDISDSLTKKIKAMQLYESETRPFPHPRSPLALESIARKWGSTIGVHAAEPFEVVRELR
jgi:LmbE family N-acetylglucosaminyl deacetylase